MSELKISAIAPWFGSNRMAGQYVGEELRGIPFVAIPFAGSLAELPYIDAKTVVVNDKHKALINLARVMADRDLGPRLYRRLRRVTFSAAELDDAQAYCRDREATENNESALFAIPDCDLDPLAWAERYFVAVWCGRSACAGTDGELRGGLSVRYDAAGGDSAIRFHNAVASIPAWRKQLRRCSFTHDDFADVFHRIEQSIDRERKKGKGVKPRAIYCDPPFPDAGDGYKHKFNRGEQHDLCNLATSIRDCRVVMRFYDHPLIRELYAESDWRWRRIGGRDQANQAKPEVLLIRDTREGGKA